jgi:small subunit ribosomal protein S2
MISLEQMLSSSVHLGHQVQQWNPKMGPYIYGERNGIHIIDLLQTLVCLENTCTFLSNASKSNKK